MTVLAVSAIIVLFVPMARSRVKPYYSGEAVNFNNQIYIGTTNTGILEIFGLNQDKLYRKSTIMAQDGSDFYDLFFRIEDYRLYVYLVNGDLFKYDITDPYFPVEVARISDNSQDSFTSVLKAGNYLATVGTKGVKIWNDDLQVINAYDIKAKSVNNISFSDNGDFIYNYSGKNIEIIDTRTRERVVSAWVDVIDTNHNQKPLGDDIDGSVYFVDDSNLRKISLSGQQNNFEHISHVGYDVASIPGRNYVYFSDGYGVVRSDKLSLDPLAWAYTTDMGPVDAWAMGIDAVSSANGDVVVVFNGSSILVLDDNLELIDYYAGVDQDLRPTEPLRLSADKYRAAPNSRVSLLGGGFGAYEDIEISFSGNIYSVEADEFGKFERIIRVPSVFPGMTDIKVDGQRTGLTYSVAFEIE
ncbi:hypothetical protein C0584_02740 [Candidatus Parcubacteria bacterium]|nr:MAG: hypothetical protein C0584_02740 [Candidatus Parcubacteria bacterium]